jgi:hypothetical protein
MGCEESFITMKLHWHSYLVFNLGSRAHETCTETGLIHIFHLVFFLLTQYVLLTTKSISQISTQPAGSFGWWLVVAAGLF